MVLDAIYHSIDGKAVCPLALQAIPLLRNLSKPSELGKVHVEALALVEEVNNDIVAQSPVRNSWACLVLETRDTHREYPKPLGLVTDQTQAELLGREACSDWMS